MSTHATRTQQVNLMDPSLLQKRHSLTRNRLLTLMGMSTMLVGAHAALERIQLDQQLGSLTPSSTAEVALNAPALEADVLPAHLLSLQDQLTRGETLRSALAQNGDLPDDAGAVLNAVIAALPEAVWLTEVQVLGDKSLLISGGTLTQPALADFSKQLEANPTLAGTPIAVVQLEPRQALPHSAAHEGVWTQAVEAAPVTQPTHFAFTLATRWVETRSGLGDE